MRIEKQTLILFTAIFIISQSVWASDTVTKTPVAEVSSNTTSTQFIKVKAVGQAVSVSGTVKAVSLDGKVRILQVYSPIFPKDKIVTVRDGYVVLRFTDGTLAALRAQSVLQINSYQFSLDKSPRPDDRIKLILGSGGVDISPGLVSKTNPNALTVQTPLADINAYGKKAKVAYERNLGLAYQGSGVIITGNNDKQMLAKESFVSISKKTDLPVLMSSQPALLMGTNAAFADHYLTLAVSKYGEYAAYNEKSISEEFVNADAIKHENEASDMTVDDNGNVLTGSEQENESSDTSSEVPENAAGSTDQGEQSTAPASDNNGSTTQEGGNNGDAE